MAAAPPPPALLMTAKLAGIILCHSRHLMEMRKKEKSDLLFSLLSLSLSLSALRGSLRKEG